jgi:hypothetical protein
VLGSDPLSPDTDLDGIADAEDTRKGGLRTVDADGDLVADIDQAARGLDPQNADTDGAGAVDGLDPAPNEQERSSSDRTHASLRRIYLRSSNITDIMPKEQTPCGPLDPHVGVVGHERIRDDGNT